MASASEVRVRIAPSPTGPIHVGNLHTALFNWLFARHEGGAFILRFEDTDQARSERRWEDVIYQELSWLGLTWDEAPDRGGPVGPYRQMERLEIYARYARTLLSDGRAYPCYCTAEELEAARRAAQAAGRPPLYDRRCRDLSAAERARREAAGIRPAIRFAVPDGREIVFVDRIRGEIRTPSSAIGDFVIMRPNGIPVYNFAVAVDDITMRISHVIRGEGHISNTPAQVLIYEALGAPLPEFVHVPHIVGPDRKKLSKRAGDAYVGEYRDRGFLPEAVLNFMALLGWSPASGKEILSPAEMIEEFSLERVTKAAAIFDLEKLLWMNGHYIRALPLDELVRRCIPFLQAAGLIGEALDESTAAMVRGAVALEQERIKTLAEIVEGTRFFFEERITYDPASWQKVMVPEAFGHLERLRPRLGALTDWEAPALEALCRAYVSEAGVKPKAVFQPVRVALTGKQVSPPLFETMALLGRERCLVRLDDCLSRWRSGVAGAAGS
ncbi:MAG TPA: glutamate--tRNA ligase [Limnochordia bacterium]